MSKSHRRPASRQDYRIAVICTLPIESDAVKAMFDEDWEDGLKYAKVENDSNAYTTGRIGGHYVVLAFMPGLCKANAAKLTTAFKINFPKIRLGLVVGICGGTPYIREYPREPREIDVFLGDIIISTEVLQHDLGNLYSNGFVRIDTLLGRPNGDEIRAFLHKMRGIKGRRLQHKIRGYLADISLKPGFEKSRYQGMEKDILYKWEYLHKHHESTDCVCAQHEDKACQKARESTCEDLKCNSGQSVLRTRLRKVEDDAANQANASNKGAKAPSPVASGDSVVKSAIYRDELANKNEVIGFEMEGAGGWDGIPIVIIKSVVDYADSHKSYLWQRYGAACGAACMKAFVNEWSPTEKALQFGAGPSAQILSERQTGESSGEPREKSETRSELKNPSKHVKDDLDNAYALFRSPCKSRKNLEAALQILSKVKDELIYLDSSTRQRMYWGLMTVEKELSCYGGFETAEKMEHIIKAQKYGIEVKKIVLQSSDASLDAQVSLEQHIIEGKKALLDFKVKKDVDKLKRLKSEAKAGIDASLGKLQEVDPKSDDMVIKAAMEWRKKFDEKVPKEVSAKDYQSVTGKAKELDDTGASFSELDHNGVLKELSAQDDQSIRQQSREEAKTQNLRSVLSRFGLGERPLIDGKKRVRWRCGCGRNCYDDFTELRSGAAAELEKWLNDSMRKHAGSSASNSQQSAALTSAIAPNAGSSGYQQTTESDISLQSLDPSADVLPASNMNAAFSIDVNLEKCWLILCGNMKRGPDVLLTQMNLSSTPSDKSLFDNMKSVYSNFKQSWTLRSFLRGVKTIRFVQFQLHKSARVDIRKAPDMPPEPDVTNISMSHAI